MGSPADRAKDVLSQVYEDFHASFASADGKKGGQLHSPFWVARVSVEAHSDKVGNISINGPFVQLSAFASLYRSARILRNPRTRCKRPRKGQRMGKSGNTKEFR